VECPHHEDEADCGCSDGMFECRSNSRCVPSSWRSDGTADFEDSSDENDCNTGAVTTPRSKLPCEEFTCGNGECLTFSQVCDSFSDCSDGSDEGGRCSK
jgi:hypothetical protein